MSNDARLPRTNREVLSDLNDTEISMASAQGGTRASRARPLRKDDKHNSRSF